MRDNDPIPYHYDQPLVGGTRKQARSIRPRRIPPALSLLLFLVLLVAVPLLVLCLFVAAPRMISTTNHYDQHHVSRLGDSLRYASEQSRNQSMVDQEVFRQARGRELYEVMIRQELADSILFKLVSLNSTTDDAVGEDWLEDEKAELPVNACSYTAPRGGDLEEVLGLKGKERVVLITFNSRNWSNYPEEGIIVLWSDGEYPEFYSVEEMHENYGITEEEWNDPAGKLFGRKHPFQHTYE